MKETAAFQLPRPRNITSEKIPTVESATLFERSGRSCCCGLESQMRPKPPNVETAAQVSRCWSDSVSRTRHESRCKHLQALR